jgi:outer membrane protein
MPTSSRAIWALGLGLFGVTGLVASSTAQTGVGQAAPKAAAPTGTHPTPAVIASVDLDAVFKGYGKVKDSSELLKTDALNKQNDLMKISLEMKKLTEKMQQFQPGSSDQKKLESEFTKLKAQLEAEREQAQHDFAQREAEALGGLYKEVQTMVSRVAAKYGYTYVIKSSNEPVDGTDPNSVMAAMARSVIYADPSTDITQIVLFNLNKSYELQKDQAKGSSPAPAAATTTAAPRRTATAPAPASTTPKAN